MTFPCPWGLHELPRVLRDPKHPWVPSGSAQGEAVGVDAHAGDADVRGEQEGGLGGGMLHSRSESSSQPSRPKVACSSISLCCCQARCTFSRITAAPAAAPGPASPAGGRREQPGAGSAARAAGMGQGQGTNPAINPRCQAGHGPRAAPARRATPRAAGGGDKR